MDIQTIIGHLDRTMNEEVKRFKNTDEIPMFARMEDLTARYISGYLFMIDESEHQSMVFVGIFETVGKVFVTLVYQVELQVPESLKKNCVAFCNYINAKFDGLKMLYDAEKIRLYTTSFVSVTNTQKWFLQFLKHSKDQFSTCMKKIMGWMLSDPNFRKEIAKSELEIKKLLNTQTIICHLDLTMDDKVKRFKDTNEIPMFARMNDLEALYIRGYLFMIEESEHQSKVFVGIFETVGKVFVTLVYQVELKVPESLRGSCGSFCNDINAKLGGLKMLYEEEIRLYTTSFVSVTNTQKRFLKFLKHSNAQYSTCMAELVEWMLSDPIVKQKIAKSELEIQKLLVKDFQRSLTLNKTMMIVQKVLNKRELTKLQRQKTFTKAEITHYFSFQNTMETTCPMLRSLSFAIFTITPVFLSFRLYFSLKDVPFSFLSRFYDAKLLECLEKLNADLEFGHFELEKENGLKVFAEIKVIYFYLNPDEVRGTVDAMITECERICCTNFPKICNFIVNERPAGRLCPEDLGEEHIKRQNAEASECRKPESREEERIPIIEQPQPISSFDGSQISSFFAVLPEKSRKLFCLDTEFLPLRQLVHWVYWECECGCRKDENSTSKALSFVAKGFKQLWNQNITFKYLPLDYATLDPSGDLVILPLFPIENIVERKGEIEAEIVELNIQCEILHYLSSKTSKEQYAMLQDLKVYREMEDVDYISPDKFSIKALIRPGESCGSGGYGEVYPNILNGVPVALKAAKKSTEKVTYSRSSVQAEFAAMQACTHANVVRALGYTEYESQALLVMERCKDEPLSRYIQHNVLSLQERVRILTEVADALTLMHAKNIAHLDIKPQNVLLTEELTPKLCDFGSSLFSSAARTGNPITIMYAAPEQVQGNPGLPSDVWSFGILMYYTLFGKNPFDYVKEEFSHLKKREVFKKIIERRCEPLFEPEFEQTNPILDCVNSSIRSCLQYEPGHRPVFNDIVLQLDDILTSPP